MTLKVLKFTTHFEAFIHFAKTQPNERFIYHSSWCSCAIGNYHDEATSEPPRNSNEIVDLSGGIDFGPIGVSPLLTELERNHRYIFESLNRGYVLAPGDEDGHDIETYGSLAKFMEEYAFFNYDENEDRGHI